ncbi:hypothetical protein BH10ACI3_BH10ACI3_12110 [soil metagenome]
MGTMDIWMRWGGMNAAKDIFAIAAGVGKGGIEGGRGAPNGLAGQGVAFTKKSLKNAKK